MLKQIVAGVIVTTISCAAWAGPSERQCFRRNYDTAHLTNHPDQTVANMWLVLATDDPSLSVVRAQSTFEMGVRLSGRDDWLGTGGYCRTENGQVVCSVLCDGGGVAITPSSGGAMLVNLEKPFGRIMLTSCEGDQDVELTAGIDDKLFRLDAVPCDGVEAQSWNAETLTKPQPAALATANAAEVACVPITEKTTAPLKFVGHQMGGLSKFGDVLFVTVDAAGKWSLYAGRLKDGSISDACLLSSGDDSMLP